MSVLVDPALVRELSARSGDCAVEVVGVRDLGAVERCLRLAAELLLLRGVAHPEEPAEAFLHDAEVRRGAGGPVPWFDAADAEAYAGVLEALVERWSPGSTAPGPPTGAGDDRRDEARHARGRGAGLRAGGVGAAWRS